MSENYYKRKRYIPEPLPLDEYEKEQLARIPIQFLFRDPRIIKLDLSFVPIRDNCPDDISCILDLFTVDLFKRKPVRKLRDYVYENRYRIISAYSYYSAVPTIPSDVSFDDPFGKMAEQFVCEYVDRMRVRNSILIPEEAEKRDKRIELFESTYDDRNLDPSSRDFLAAKYGVTPERVRQLLLGKENTIGITLCRGIIRGEIENDDIKVNSIFQSRFYDLFFTNKYAYRRDSFLSENGIGNEKTCRFVMDLLDLTICESNVYFEPLIIKGDYITALNRNSGILIKYFSEAALYVSLVDDLAPFLQNKLNNNTELVNIMLDIVRCSDRFDQYEPGNEDVYALKWKYLQTIPGRIVRILYDAGHSMHSSSIYKEYNNRANACGIDTITGYEVFIRRTHPLLDSSGKTGYWTLKDASENNDDKLPKVRKVIEAFLREHKGKAYLNEVVVHVANVGLKYSDNSIRTYLSSMCHVVRDQADLFVHNEYVDQYPSYEYASKVKNQAQTVLPILFSYLATHNGYARMRELIEDYNGKTGNHLRDTTLRGMIANAPGILAIEKINDRDIVIKLLVPIEESLEMLHGLAASKKPEYYNQIISKAKEIIMASPNGFASLKTVFDEVVVFVPENRRKNIVYKLLQNESEFESYIVDKKRFIRMSNKD